eukprot:tig00000388_g24829.t1
MPDLSAKAKKGSADFKKSKIKIGRKLAKPANQTSTDFKSKRLQILNQSVTEDKGSFVNQRKLNLADLLSQSKHYSPNVRRDALFGLKDLLERHPGAMAGHVGAVLEALCERVADPEASVRHALRVAFAHVAGLLDEAQVGPFAGLLVVHLCSGMTHIAERVRLDALPLLDTLVDRFPAALAPHAPSCCRTTRTSSPTAPARRLQRRPASSTGQGPAAPASACARAGAGPGARLHLRGAAGREWLAPSGCRVSLEAHRRPRRPAPQMPPSRPFAPRRGAGAGWGGAGRGRAGRRGAAGGAPGGGGGEAVAEEAGRPRGTPSPPSAPPPTSSPSSSPPRRRPGRRRRLRPRPRPRRPPPLPLEAPADDESLLTPTASRPAPPRPPAPATSADSTAAVRAGGGANVALCEALSFGLEVRAGRAGSGPPGPAPSPPTSSPSSLTAAWRRGAGRGAGGGGDREADAGALGPLWGAALAAFERAHALSRAKRRALDTLAGALLPPARAPRGSPRRPRAGGGCGAGLVKLLCQLRGRAPRRPTPPSASSPPPPASPRRRPRALRASLARSSPSRVPPRPAPRPAPAPARSLRLRGRGRRPADGGPVVHLTEGQQRAAVELLFHAAAGDELLPAPLLSALAFACNGRPARRPRLLRAARPEARGRSGDAAEATVRHAAEVICAAAAARGPAAAPAAGFLLSLLAAAPPAAAAARAPPPPPPCAP